MSKEIRFDAFAMNCVGHMAPGLWRHPRDRSDRYIDLTYWTELAQLLERGKFDGLFLADVLGPYEADSPGILSPDIWTALPGTLASINRRSTTIGMRSLKNTWRFAINFGNAAGITMQ